MGKAWVKKNMTDNTKKKHFPFVFKMKRDFFFFFLAVRIQCDFDKNNIYYIIFV